MRLWQGRIFVLCLFLSVVPQRIMSRSISRFERISAGGYHTIALKSDGTLWFWGWNNSGQLGDGTTADKSSPVQIYLVPTGTISGKVTKSDGATGIYGAIVEVLQGGVAKSSTTTDTSGNYSITLTTGTYDVRASATGYQTQTKTGITVSAGQTTTVNFALLETTEQKPQPEYKTTLGDNLFSPSKGGSCKVGFYVPSSGKVSIKIYDLMGRNVRTLVDENFTTGNFQEDWDGRDDNNEIVLPGVYILHYQYPDGKETRKIGIKR